MADDPTRYLDVSGVLALKYGSTVDVDYTVTHARSVVARLGEVGARITYAAAESEARDDTLYKQVQQVRAVAERPQYADNGDGTGTLLLSSTITDNGDGTGTIGA